MTFSAELKRELCRTEPKPCCATAELYGALLFAHTFTPRLVKVISTHGDVMKRLDKLLIRVAGFGFDQGMTLRDEAKLRLLFDRFGLVQRPGQSVHINHALLEESCCRASFCRGVFLTGGSVTDPEKKYHMEILTPHRHLCRELLPIFYEHGFEPKPAERAGIHLLVFQSSETIADVLTFMGAPLAALKLMDTKMMKEMRNQVNRAVNCETGNLERTVAAATRQIERFAALRKTPKWKELPLQLKATALARMESPDASLAELAESLELSKSALNHRLRKLEGLCGTEK